MNCPFCHSRSKVTDSRDGIAGVRRRRQCLACTRRFTTYEKMHVISSMVRKEDGSLEPYSPDKLRKGIKLACAKRGISFETVASRVEQQLYSRLGNQDCIRSCKIGELIMDELRATDRVAYIRFASVYRNFADTDDFVTELASLAKRNAVNSDQLALFKVGDDSGGKSAAQPGPSRTGTKNS